MTHQIFVYGTLRPTGRYWPNIAGFNPEQTDAAVSGFDMFALPEGYPAILQGDGIVNGTLLTFAPSTFKDVLAVTDDIEGYSENATGLYRRETVGVPEHGDALIYIYNNAPYARESGVRIRSGDWFSR